MMDYSLNIFANANSVYSIFSLGCELLTSLDIEPTAIVVLQESQVELMDHTETNLLSSLGKHKCSHFAQ